MTKPKPRNPLKHECPRCHAQPEHPCRSPNGKTCGPHAARRNPQAPTPAHRPGLLTPELTDEICRNLRLGAPLNMAAQASGISIATIYRWLAEADTEPEDAPPGVALRREFREAITRARAQSGIVQLSRVNEVARRHLKSRKALRDDEGKIIRNAAGEVQYEEVWEQDWRAAAFILERSFARDFGRREVVELSGSDGVEPALSPAGATGTDGAGIERIAANLQEFKARKELEEARRGGEPLEGTVTTAAERQRGR